MRNRQIIPGLLLLLTVAKPLSAQETSKLFPQYQCRFKLPGKDWSWVDASKVPGAACVARNEKAGLVFNLIVTPVPAGATMNRAAAASFEKDFYSTKGLTKRGAMWTTFKGLSCYQGTLDIAGGRTGVILVMAANGFSYQLQLIGGSDPVERRPDFDAIINSFEFTSPPVTTPTGVNTGTTETPKNISYRMGQVAGICLMAALLLAILFRVFWKTERKKKKRRL